MEITRRTRIGMRLASAGGVLMILGGIGDLSIRRLLPGHEAFLGGGPEGVPAATEILVLALLHALGASLVAAGFAVLVLLYLARLTGRRLPAITAAMVATLAEGMNVAGLVAIDSFVFVAPLVFLLFVVVGVGMCLLPRWELGSSLVPREASGKAPQLA